MTTSDERFTRRPPAEPRLELLETCWRFVGPSGRLLTCGIYRTDAGVEVRVGYGEEELVYSRLAIEIGTARETAAELRQAVIAKGGFTELEPGGA